MQADPGWRHCTGVGRPALGPSALSAGLANAFDRVADLSGGLGDPFEGLADLSVGLANPSVGLTDPSVGLPDPSVGLPEPFIRLADPSVGLADPFVGLAGIYQEPGSVRQFQMLAMPMRRAQGRPPFPLGAPPPACRKAPSRRQATGSAPPRQWWRSRSCVRYTNLATRRLCSTPTSQPKRKCMPP